jgi:hypothetical protein
MDFIEGLAKSEGYNSILVVVDRFSKYAHFIPLKHPFTTPQVALVFLDEVVRIHGMLLALIKHRFHATTCRVNVWNNHVFTLSTNLVPQF